MRFAACLLGLFSAVLSTAASAIDGAPPVPAVAQSATTASPPAAADSRWAYDLAGDLMSPFCPGRTLASCPSPQAGELIQWIAMQEAAGVSRDEVVRMLVERHGEDILGAPPARGFALWAYVLPVVGFVGFGGIALLVLRRIVRPAAAVSSEDIAVAGAAADGSVRAGEVVAARAGSGGDGPHAVGSAVAAAELARIVDAELAERA